MKKIVKKLKKAVKKGKGKAFKHNLKKK